MEFRLTQLEHKIAGKTKTISFDGLVQSTDANSV